MFDQNRMRWRTTLLVILPLLAFSGPAQGWNEREHQVLADSAFNSVLIHFSAVHGGLPVATANLCSLMQQVNPNFAGRTFGAIASYYSGNDLARARSHRTGLTVFQQLQMLPADEIEAVMHMRAILNSNDRNATVGKFDIQSAEASHQSVVSNFLLHHLIALRLAHYAGQSENQNYLLHEAFIYEAMALTYLCDAFSAGHLFVPLHDLLSGLHPINNKQAHDYHRSQGLFVLNGYGQVWQAYGDDFLNWDEFTYERVLEACISSVNEIMLAYYATSGHDEFPSHLREWYTSQPLGLPLEQAVEFWLDIHPGTAYYAEGKMPSLLRIPIPVHATWSVRTNEKDEHGIHQRVHFPQLREEGYHNPDLADFQPIYLYSKSGFPAWQFPDSLGKKDPRELIKHDVNYASVRYVQRWDYPPSYMGTLLIASAGHLFNEVTKRQVPSFGLGWGFLDELFFIKKMSIDALIMPAFGEPQRLLLSPTFGFGVALGHTPLGLVEAIRFDFGHAWGMRQPFKGHGSKFAIGLETPTLGLGFTYAGATFRLKYQRINVEQDLRGVFMEMVLH